MGDPPSWQDVERRHDKGGDDRIPRHPVTVGLVDEVRPTWPQRLRKAGLHPLIQVEVVVQEKAKGQVTSRETVVRMNGAEVRVVNDEQQKQQEAGEDQIPPRSGAGEARRSSAEVIRTRRSWSTPRTFSLPFPWARISRHGSRVIVPARHGTVNMRNRVCEIGSKRFAHLRREKALNGIG